ncbi:MAG TPA: RNA polymerase sigma-70 factor, partial [Sphingobacteriaceae bacterium]
SDMTDFKEVSDNDLLELLKKDDVYAFKEIYKRYWKKVYGAAYKRLKSKELSEEIVQELFVTLWSKRQALQLRTSLSGYFHSSVSHYIIDRYRKELVRQKYRDAFKASYVFSGNSTEETYNLKELSHTIEKEVLQLPDKCRSVYELSRKENKSNKEIALHLGISEKTVENHLTKALNRLRVSLNNYLFLFILLLIK